MIGINKSRGRKKNRFFNQSGIQRLIPLDSPKNWDFMGTLSQRTPGPVQSSY